MCTPKLEKFSIFSINKHLFCMILHLFYEFLGISPFCDMGPFISIHLYLLIYVKIFGSFIRMLLFLLLTPEYLPKLPLAMGRRSYHWFSLCSPSHQIVSLLPLKKIIQEQDFFPLTCHTGHCCRTSESILCNI